MLVCPGLCGVAVYSAKLDRNGNSAKGLAFCRALVQQIPELKP